MTESRTLGSLIGLATGDALGAPMEGLPAPPAPVRDMIGGGIHRRRAGMITDDTLQALAVTRSLIERRRFDPADLIPRLLDSYRRQPEWFGPTSSLVFEYILQGVPAETASRIVHEARGSRSNGSVMRGPPLGLFFRDPGQVREISLLCSRLTHRDPVAGECSAILNIMISRLCRGSPKELALRDALHLCADDEVRDILSRYWEYPIDPSLDALLTTHAAISLFLTNRSFESALIAAVNQGGDADTLGALTGALAGAYYGVDSIPARWQEDLQDAAQIWQTAWQFWEVAES